MSDQTMKELMITDILRVHLTDSMQSIYQQLSEQPDRFVVVLDEENVPLYLTTADEIKRKMPRGPEWPSVGSFAARLPEALLVDENVTLSRAMVFFSTISSLEPQPRGLVVMHDDEAAGVLSYDVLVGYFKDVTVLELEAKGVPTERGDAGTPQTIANAVFRCRRYPRCSFESTADLVDKPPLCGVLAAHGRTKLQT